MSEFLSPPEAREQYNLRTVVAAELSEAEATLAKHGIASIEMPLSASDFQRLSEGFAICLDECPELLADTAFKVDHRFGSDAGYVRKEKSVDQATGQQLSDPKNYFHFNENMRPYWNDRFVHGPKILRDFLADGYEIHDALIGIARQHVAGLETTHPNMSQLYFPPEPWAAEGQSHSFLRLLRYDGYAPDDMMGEVAKPHFDIGGVTIQAYADAPGFWGSGSDTKAPHEYYETNGQTAYSFFGKGHEKIYGRNDLYRPLWHGVDRIIPVGATWVPERTAVILFVDAPMVDFDVQPTDTLPYLKRGLGSQAMAPIV